jgi:adenosylhomocysteine nucleosidase
MQTLVVVAACSMLLAPVCVQAVPRILVVTAVDYEYAAVAALLEQKTEDVLGGRQFATGQVGAAAVAVIRAGWGKAHAAGATSGAIQRFRPQLVVMAGSAAGVDPTHIRSGDVVISRGTFQYDVGQLSHGTLQIWRPQTPLEHPYPHENFLSPDHLVRLAVTAAHGASFPQWTLPAGCTCLKDGRRTPACAGPEQPVGRAQPQICAGVLATGDAFVVDPRFAAKLARERRAVSVDMETAAVAQEAADHGVPFLGVRVIADVVGASTSTSLYDCLKPLTGPRLGAVMAHVLSALGALTQLTEADDGAPMAECPQSRAAWSRSLKKPARTTPSRLLQLR